MPAKQTALSSSSPSQPPMTEPKKPCCSGKVYWIVLAVVAAVALGISLYVIFAGEVKTPPAQNMVWPEREAADETADWQTYRNEAYGFEVKYPLNYNFKERAEGGVSLVDFYPEGEEKIWDFSLATSRNQKGVALRDYLADYYKFSDLKFNEIKTKQGITALKPATQTAEYWAQFSPLGSGLEYYYWLVGNKNWVVGLYHNQAVSISGKLAEQILSTFKFIEPAGGRILDNPFSLQEIKVGDIVAGMKAESVEPYNKQFPFRRDNASVVFSGRLIIKGKFGEASYGGFSGGIMLFGALDEASLVKIPKLKGETRELVFWFSNQAFAKEEARKVGGSQVTIIIDGYTINNYPSEVFNATKLIEVLD